MKKKTTNIVLIAISLTLACRSDESTVVMITHEITIAPSQARIVLGDSVQFRVGLSSDLTMAGARLRSERSDVVRISAAGWVTGIAVGTAQVVATANADTLVTTSAQIDVVARSGA